MSDKDVSIHIAEVELEKRLKKRREPLRQPTYDEEKIKKDKAEKRRVARYKQKQRQAELNPQKETTQRSLFAAPEEEKPTKVKSRKAKQPKPQLEEDATESMESEATALEGEEEEELEETELKSPTVAEEW